MRIRRGQLRGVKLGRTWHVYLDGAAEPNQGEQPERTEPNRANERTEQRPAAAAGIIARQDAEIAYLRAALEREQQASAELRRMLNLEQQTLAAQAQTPLISAPTM